MKVDVFWFIYINGVSSRSCGRDATAAEPFTWRRKLTLNHIVKTGIWGIIKIGGQRLKLALLFVCPYYYYYPYIVAYNPFRIWYFILWNIISKENILWWVHVSHTKTKWFDIALRWRHNKLVGVSNHQPHDCLYKRLFTRRSEETSKLRVTGLCAENSPVTGEFPAQRASHAENVSIWWRHHVLPNCAYAMSSCT